MIDKVIFFIFITILFFVTIDINKNISRCNTENKEDFDGNGQYQYKGRGDKSESVDILLSRIDWLAKNSYNKSLYTTAYIISYIILIAVFFICYACNTYSLSVWEMILIILTNFIVCFSILNLLNFHTERYNDYYIRNNVDIISEKLGLYLYEPPKPIYSTKLERTMVQDVLSK
jgi:hypothetical protein